MAKHETVGRGPRSSPTRRPRRDELAPATGLAAKLEAAAKTGKLPKVAERPIVGNKDVASKLFGGKVAKQPDLVAPEPDEPDEDWEAELPPLDPADLADALGNSLESRAVTEADVDRLWDWIRADGDKGKAFLGATCSTSAQLRAALTAFGPHLFALDDMALEGERHIGLVAVQMFDGDKAGVHLYLTQAARGDGRRLIPQLMTMAHAAFPGKVFVIITGDAAAARLYRAVGFSMGFMLTWIPKPEPELATEPEPEPETIPDDTGDDDNG